jgi:hypothetical protein
MYITWDEAVEEGKRLIVDLESSQMRLGEIADRIQPKYGESTLAQYAQELKMNLNTLQNLRSVYRTWHEDLNVKSIPKFSVAKALVGHPDRAKIVEERPDITEREAKEETKKFKAQKATYETYSDQAAHKLTKSIVTGLDSFLEKNSSLDGMLDHINILNMLDMEYAEKIIFALNRANERVVGALQRLNVKMETYQKPADTNTETSTEDAPEKLTEDSDAPAEMAGEKVTPRPRKGGTRQSQVIAA